MWTPGLLWHFSMEPLEQTACFLPHAFCPCILGDTEISSVFFLFPWVCWITINSLSFSNHCLSGSKELLRVPATAIDWCQVKPGNAFFFFSHLSLLISSFFIAIQFSLPPVFHKMILNQRGVVQWVLQEQAWWICFVCSSWSGRKQDLTQKLTCLSAITWLWLTASLALP